MAQPAILIIDNQRAGRAETQLGTILRQEGGYRVKFVDGPVLDSLGADVDLIVLVLPSSRERADELLAEVGAQAVFTPLVVVMGADMVPESWDVLPANADFLVTPVRTAELLARIRRLLSPRGGDTSEARSRSP